MKYVKFSSNRSMEEASQIFEARIRDAKIVFEKFSKDFYERPCPFCKSEEFEPLEKFAGLYDIALCKSCMSEYVSPVPTMEAISYYYNECENNVLFEQLNQRRHKKSFINDDRIDFIKPCLTELLENREVVHVLEVGCNNGSFLSTLKDYLVDQGLQDRCVLHGIDLDEDAVANSVDTELDLRVVAAEELVRLGNKYDLVVSFELIEHLADPGVYAESLHASMNEGAFLALTTPNASGLEIKATGYNGTRLLAHSIFPPMHLNAFNTRNILLFAHLHRFKLIDVKTPGRLDMDMVTTLANEIEDESLVKLTSFPEEVKAYIQYLVSYLGGSSHMRVILQK